MVKELEDAPRDEVVVLLDCDARGQVGVPPDSSFDLAVRAAGSILGAHARRARRAVLALNGLRPVAIPITSLDGDWHAALEALAAAEPDGTSGAADLVGREGGLAARALELTVVTARLEPRLVDRLAQRAMTHRGISVVWVDAASFTGRPTTREPALQRLSAAGAAVAVLRRGDDLAAKLGAPAVSAKVVHA